jgi:beta-glucanase (GH16 family)/phenylpyruvate tautomerase PptA (4-oxalocrotonate tautomerase family)
MNIFLKIIFSLSLSLVSSVSSARWEMTFNDDFNSSTLDKKWRTTYRWGDRTHPGNGELQCYSDEGIKVVNGTVQLIAFKKDTVGCQPAASTTLYKYQSGMITTLDSFSQLYGYFEIRTKLPAGQGMWPAFWMVPLANKWPPEIDVFEFLMEDPTILHSTFHWRTETNTTASKGFTAIIDDPSKEFHTYGVDWQKNLVIYYVDGIEVGRMHSANVPNEPMVIIANLALGGWAKVPNEATVFPAKMEIDYIRVYKRVADAVDTTLPPSTNLLNNGDFERGVTNWNLTSAVISNVQPYAGGFSAELKGAAKALQTISILKPNSTYELSAMVRSLSGSPVVIGAQNFGQSAGVQVSSSNPNFTKVSVRFTTGQAAVSADLFASLVAGSAQVDNMVLTKISGAPSLIINPNFEEGAKGWVLNSAANPATISSDSYEGLYSGQISGNSSLYQVVTGLQPNTNYELSASVSSIDGRTVTFGAVSFNGSLAVSSSTAVTSFRPVSLKFKTGPTNTSVKIFFSATQATGLIDSMALKSLDIDLNPNLVVNPGFENDKTGWNFNAQAPSIAQISPVASSGTKAALISGVSGVFQRIAGLKSNTTYYLSAMAKSVDGSYVALGAKEFNGVNASVRSNNTSYQLLTVSFTTGDGELGTKAQIYAYLGAGSAIVDDFKLIEAPKNFIVNPGFENDKTGWNFNAQAPSIAQISTSAYTGTKAALISGVSGVFQRISGLKSNTTYTLTAMVKSVDGSYVALGAKEFNGVNASQRTNLKTYQKLSVTFTTGDGELGTKAQIYAYLGVGSAIADDFVLTEGK